MTFLGVFCTSYLPSSKRIDSPTFKKECFHIPCINLHTLLEERLVLHRETILDASQLSLNDLMGVDICHRLTGSGIAIEQCSLMIQKVESVCAQHFPHWDTMAIRRVFCGTLFLAQVISNVTHSVTQWWDSLYIFDIPFRDLGEAIAYLIEYDRDDQLKVMLDSRRFTAISIDEYCELFLGISKVMTTMKQHTNDIEKVCSVITQKGEYKTMFLGILFLSAAIHNDCEMLVQLMKHEYFAQIPAKDLVATSKELSKKCAILNLKSILSSVGRRVFSNQDIEDIVLNIIESGGADAVTVIMDTISSMQVSADVFIKGLMRAIELDRVAIVQRIVNHSEFKNISIKFLTKALQVSGEKSNQMHMVLLDRLLNMVSLGFCS